MTMSNLSQYNQYHRLPLSGHGGTIIHFEFPTGTGTYTPKKADALVCHKDVKWAGSGLFQLQSNGYAHPSGANSRMIINTEAGIDSMPEKTTDCRLYEVWGRCTNTANLVDYDGARVTLNNDDSGNRWFFVHQINPAKDQWDDYFAEYVSTVWTFRAAPADIPVATVGANSIFNFRIYDYGDSVLHSIEMYDEDTNTNIASEVVGYHATSRPNAGLENLQVTVYSGNTGNDGIQVRGFRVSDI